VQPELPCNFQLIISFIYNLLLWIQLYLGYLIKVWFFSEVGSLPLCLQVNCVDKNVTDACVVSSLIACDDSDSWSVTGVTGRALHINFMKN
jgi:hypothetical protein